MSDRDINSPKRKPPATSWDNWIEESIRAAQERGDFDNLPGQGRPLPDWRNPHLPHDQQMAHDLIRNSGHTLRWVDDAKEIDRRIEAARQQLLRNDAWYQKRRQEARSEEIPAIEATWFKHRARFEEDVVEINALIDTYNLKAPSTQLHKFRLIPAEEYKRLSIGAPPSEPA